MASLLAGIYFSRAHYHSFVVTPPANLGLIFPLLTLLVSTSWRLVFINSREKYLTSNVRTAILWRAAVQVGWNGIFRVFFVP